MNYPVLASPVVSHDLLLPPEVKPTEMTAACSKVPNSPSEHKPRQIQCKPIESVLPPLPRDDCETVANAGGAGLENSNNGMTTTRTADKGGGGSVSSEQTVFFFAAQTHRQPAPNGQLLPVV